MAYRYLLLNAASYTMAKFCAHLRDDHVQDMLGFMSIRVVVPKMTFKKIPHVGLQCRSQKAYKPPWPRRVLLIALILIAAAGAAAWLAACRAGVYQPSSLSLNQAVAAQRAATACDE